MGGYPHTYYAREQAAEKIIQDALIFVNKTYIHTYTMHGYRHLFHICVHARVYFTGIKVT